MWTKNPQPYHLLGRKTTQTYCIQAIPVYLLPKVFDIKMSFMLAISCEIGKLVLFCNICVQMTKIKELKTQTMKLVCIYSESL